MDLREVDETRDGTIELEKYTELRKTKDRSLDDITDLVFISEYLPRICLQSLDGERDFLSFDTDNLDSHLISGTSMLMRIVHMSPVDLRDVYETFYAVECDEESVSEDSRDISFDDITDLDRLDRCSTLLFDRCFF